MKAYKTFESCPESQRINGVPLSYPWQVQDCTVEQTEHLQSQGFTVITDEAFASYIAQSEFDVVSGVKRVPKSVTPRQIRTALVLSGHSLTSIETALNQLPEPNKSVAVIAWEYSVEFQRDNPLIQSMSPLLGLTSDEIDDIFIQAAQL